MKVEICLISGWRFSKEFDKCRRHLIAAIQLAVDHLELAVLFSLPCPETDWKICNRKQGYAYIQTDFKKRSFDVSSLTDQSVSAIILKLLTTRKISHFKNTLI